MRTARFSTTVFLTMLAMAGAAGARPTDPAGTPMLFILDSAAQPQVSRTVSSEEIVIELAPATVAANPPTMIVQLPDLPPLEALRTRFTVYRSDWKTWSGTLRPVGAEGDGAGLIHLDYFGAHIAGLIGYGGARYRIDGSREEGHRLVRLVSQPDALPCIGEHPTTVAEPPGGRRLIGERDEPSETGYRDFPGTDAALVPQSEALTNPVRLDLLVVYPRALLEVGAEEETRFQDFIKTSVSLANLIFSNSNVEAVYNLVGAAPLLDDSDPPPPTGTRDGLLWLDGRYPVGTLVSGGEAARLRDAFGADIVVMLIPFSWDANLECGVANEPRAGYLSYRSADGLVNAPFEDRAFSVQRAHCGLDDYTLAHEVGHNYGMRHLRLENTTLEHLFPNGRGHDLARGVSTVMSCTCPATGCVSNESATCNRIPHFSDPNISFEGEPTGTADRNNAEVGRTQVGFYAQMRAASTNVPPTADFSVSCAARTCSFDAGLSSDGTPLPADGYWWSFGDGTIGTGRTVSHTYGAYGTFGVHLVLTDSGGQRVVRWKEVVTAPVYAGVHEVANCRSIAGWAWDQGQPNQPINVHILRDLGILATIPANIFRQDLLDAGKGNGAHGFNYVPTPSWKDGRWHAAKVRFGGTTTDLASTPRNVICGVTCFTTQMPGGLFVSGAAGLTVATQFSSTHAGYITHLRFYRGSGETGTNVGRLWSDSGTLLAEAAFPSSPTSGWVEVAIPPVAITAGTRYRAGVNTNSRYVKSGCGLGSGITNQVLTAHQGFQSAGNGTFPTTGSCANYFVDVKFDL